MLLFTRFAHLLCCLCSSSASRPARVLSTRVLSREALNVSPHDPVVANINIITSLDTKHEKNRYPHLEQATRPIRWEYVNKDQFHQNSERLIQPILRNIHSDPPEELVDKINQALYIAAAESLIRKPPTKLRKQRPIPWDQSLNPHVAEVKRRFWKWKQAGSPRDLNHPERIAMKTGKKSLRSAQRQLYELQVANRNNKKSWWHHMKIRDYSPN